MKRREFLKAAMTTSVAVTAGSPLSPVPGRMTGQTVASGRAAAPTGAGLGNATPPAFQFQAYPGGTGALMEKLWQGVADPFRTPRLDVEPWQGPVPGNAEDIAFLPVHRLSGLLKGGHLSPTALLEIYLERLRRHDPALLCVVTMLDGPAREQAAEAEREIRRGEWRGPLHGIPYGLKDLFSVPGAPTTWGAADFQQRVIDDEAEVAARLRRAGAVLVAKLSTGEFARGDRWYRGQTRNPWNPSEGSSGSSAGPASATAAGCVAFAIGSETQGSIVSPARRCGLSALRPTFGRVSRHGGMVLAWSMDKVGPLCRSVEDCALVFDAIHGADEKDPASLTTPFNFSRTPELPTLRIGYRDDAPASVLDTLRRLGAEPEPMPELPDGSSNALRVESAVAFDFHIGPNGDPPPLSDGLSADELRRANRFRTGRDIRALDYVQEQRGRFTLMQQTEAAFDGFDLCVSGSGLITLTNQTGHPAVVVPYGFGPRAAAGAPPHDQPLTATLIGNLFADDVVLSVAHSFQQATEWHLRRPALFL